MNFKKNKKIEFEQKYPKIKWRVIRYATNYYNSDEKDFDNEHEARELERNLKSSMRNKKDYFEPARVEVKMVQRIGNEDSSYICSIYLNPYTKRLVKVLD